MENDRSPLHAPVLSDQCELLLEPLTHFVASTPAHGSHDMAVDCNEAHVLDASEQLTAVATLPLNNVTASCLKRKPPPVISNRDVSAFESSSPVAKSIILSSFCHQSLNDARPIAIELCSGSARLSAQLNACGFQAIPVDWQRNAFHECCPTVNLDLADDKAVCVF